MITISAFADEIGPDLDLQMDTCQAGGLKCIDVRGIDGINVSSMTPAQVAGYAGRLADRGFTVPCVGSPIGKIKISDDFDEHLELLKHTFEVARGFGTRLIRVFSFYPSEGAKIADQRAEVMERMAKMVEEAVTADCVLMHENEADIYGAKPDGVKDLVAELGCDHFKTVFDPANFVTEGIASYEEGWRAGLDELTDWFHIKDKVSGGRCVPAGQGDGQFREIFADLAARDWSGYMTLEPHLSRAGQFSGHTGADLFATAVAALKDLCDQVGLAYE